MVGLDRYHEDGFAVVKNLVPVPALPALEADILSAIQEAKEKAGYATLKTGNYRDFAIGLHLNQKSVADLVQTAPILSIAEKLLGPDVDLRFTSSITKTKEKNAALDWHQDSGYDKDPGHAKFSFWIAITPATRENGCLRVIPGSHKGGLVPHIPSKRFPPDKEIEAVDETGAIDMELNPGDALVLDPFIQHSSRPNLSGELRVALLAGFMKPKRTYLDFELKGSFSALRNSRRQWMRLEPQK